MSIDSTDRALLNGLRDNSRTSFVELSKATGVSERTVRTRVKKLEEDVIQRYTIIERGIGLSALVRTKLDCQILSVRSCVRSCVRKIITFWEGDMRVVRIHLPTGSLKLGF